MRIDLTSVQVEDVEREYIKQEGVFTLKVVKLTSGKTTNGNDQLKVHFQDKFGKYAIADFVLTDNALWALKVLTKALKLPNVIDTEMMLDRYVIAHIKAKRTQNGEIFEIKKYEPSKLTNTMGIPTTYEKVQNNQEAHKMPEVPKPIDVDKDEIPF